MDVPANRVVTSKEVVRSDDVVVVTSPVVMAVGSVVVSNIENGTELNLSVDLSLIHI